MYSKFQPSSANGIFFKKIEDIHSIKYTDSDSHHFLSGVAEKIGATNINGIITLPKFYGEGTLKNIELEEGLFIRSIDFRLLNDMKFTRWADTVKEKYFQLYFFPDKLNIHFSLDHQALQPITVAHSVFMSNELEVHGMFMKQEPVKVLIIMFTVEWAKQNHLFSHPISDDFLSNILSEGKKSLFLNPVSTEEYQLAADLHAAMNPLSEDKLSLKINTLQLIKSFLLHSASREEEQLKKTQSFYLPEIIKAEHRLMDYLKTSLPPIKKIALEFNMSESTLKRHFKLVYEKNIYQYYLEKKMELAKEMIQVKNLPVTAVAYTLGYEKVSSLTSVFKKVYNVLPKSFKLKKNNLNNLDRSVI
jgi:AraC-like DNA-binding protein